MKQELTHSDVEIIDEETMYAGFYKVSRYTLRHTKFDGGQSNVLQRELVKRAHAVGVLMYDPTLRQVILVSQFRVGALKDEHSPWLFEIVAGLIGPGEMPEEVAFRESEEEADIHVSDLIRITRYYPSPGGSSETLTLYIGRVDASAAGGIHGLSSEGEDIKVIPLPFEDALRGVEEGWIQNAASIIGLQWLALNREEVHRKWGVRDA